VRPPGSLILTIVPASMLRVRTRTVVRSRARTRSPLGVASRHGSWRAAAGWTTTCGGVSVTVHVSGGEHTGRSVSPATRL
jgi:hypothetical protein